MGRFFIWLSGADHTILAECTSLSRSERSRFAGLGTLVLIPASLGLLSMMYAVSTLQSDPLVYVTAGIVWFLIVIAIDRYLVSTTFKSVVQRGLSRTLGVFARVVLAGFIALIVAHPLILLIFHDTISEQLRDTQRTEIDAIRAAGEQKKAAVPPVAAPFESAAARELNQKLEQSACLGRLQTAEQSGVALSLPCGTSSSFQTCAVRCVALGEQKREVDNDIAILRPQVQREEGQQRSDLQGAERQRQATLTSIDTETTAAVEDRERNFSTDYLARVHALTQVEQERPEVRVVKWVILGLFLVIDVLPIMMKLATPSGEYEEVRDRRLTDAKVREGVTREAIQADLEDQIRIARVRHEIDTMHNTWARYTTTYAEGNEQFEASLDSVRENAGANGDGAGPEVDDLRKANNHLWAAWRERMREDLEPK
ncbi:MAG: hypothetical protein QOG43_160 [Actinomycetota bacterium]|jgi:hypothetical protein|nr:hypothetical protein [Actinomycetota bacterium]